MTRKPRSVIRTPEDLRKEKVGVHGRNREEILSALGVPFTSLPPEVDTLACLRDGSFTATVVSLDSAFAAHAENPALQVGMFVGPVVSRVFGVRKGDVALLKALNEYVENTRLSGAWQRLVVKYFGRNAVEILKSARAAQP